MKWIRCLQSTPIMNDLSKYLVGRRAAFNSAWHISRGSCEYYYFCSLIKFVPRSFEYISNKHHSGGVHLWNDGLSAKWSTLFSSLLTFDHRPFRTHTKQHWGTRYTNIEQIETIVKEGGNFVCKCTTFVVSKVRVTLIYIVSSKTSARASRQWKNSATFRRPTFNYPYLYKHGDVGCVVLIYTRLVSISISEWGH